MIFISVHGTMNNRVNHIFFYFISTWINYYKLILRYWLPGKIIKFYKRWTNMYLMFSSMLNHVDDLVGVEFQSKDTKTILFNCVRCCYENKRKLAPLMSSKNVLKIPLRCLLPEKLAILGCLDIQYNDLWDPPHLKHIDIKTKNKN